MIHDIAYHKLLYKILDTGNERPDRTGTGTISLFGEHLKFDLRDGFPLITTKKVYWKGVVYELLWFLRGDTNVKYLQENNVHIWDEWAKEDGELGPVYGVQWRKWAVDTFGSLDQITQVIDSLRADPYGRRHVVTAWNPAEVPIMALPPCHMFFQFYVNQGYLDCQMYQRSCDVFLGLPFNIASYALLTHMVAQVCDLRPGALHICLGDVHIYNNHLEQVHTQLSRDPRVSPTLSLEPSIKDIDSFRYEDIHLIGYDPHPGIKAPVAV